MKRFAYSIIFLAIILLPTPFVNAQTPADEDIHVPIGVPLTASGANFANGSADGICKTAGASCTLPNNSAGICADNGRGAGVCTSATPTIDPLFDTGCKPNEICHIAPEKVGRRNEIGQPKTKDCGQTDCTGDLWEIIQKWIGEVKPNNIYHYGTKLLSVFGPQVDDAFSKDLMPAPLQDISLYDTAPKPYCMTSRLCVYNPVTGELVGNFLTEETWCTKDPPGRIRLIQGTRLGAAYMTGYVIGTDLRLPITSVKKIAALPCGAKLDEGKKMELNDLEYVKKNYYGDDAVTRFTITIQADMVSVISKIIDDVLTLFYKAKETTPAVEVGSAENGLSASLAGLSFSVSMKDLEPFAYPKPEGKLALTQVGGVWNTYRNDAYDPTFKIPTDAIFDSQDWYYGIAGVGNIKSPTLQSMNARQQEAQTFGNCSILNANDPMYTRLNCDKKNWVAANASALSSPPNPVNTSTWAQSSDGTSANSVSPTFSAPSAISSTLVPSCVLEGVAKIEGAYDGNAPCKPNECGAYGPFQITTGRCTKACRASSCPNAAKSLGVTRDQLCDFDSAAYQASRLLVGKADYFGYDLTTADPKTQKDAIIIAGDSYYGTTNPITRLGGLSYGEWVYAHCDPSYTTHVDHSFPAAGAGTQF